MSTKTRSPNGRARRGRESQQEPAWTEADEEIVMPASAASARSAAPVAGDDDLRQLAARRKLEQYLESKRLREHLQEIFYDDER